MIHPLWEAPTVAHLVFILLYCLLAPHVIEGWHVFDRKQIWVTILGLHFRGQIMERIDYGRI